MCYDSLSLTRRALDYGKRLGYSDETIHELEEQFLRIRETQGPVFHASGYAHPSFPVLRNLEEPEVEARIWGLVPAWVKDKDQAVGIWNRTLNARSETLLEKPSFRNAAKRGRCLVVTDGFYEHHHKAGKSFPFVVQHLDEGPMVLAGISEDWTDPSSGKVWRSFSIVTTRGNALMSEIHNNPKMKGPRMPVILDREQQGLWLEDWQEEAEERLEFLTQPYRDDNLKAHPVAPIRGKKALGNVAEAIVEFQYTELAEDSANDAEQMELF